MARFTLAPRTPGTAASACSTRATHEAQCMPVICRSTVPAAGAAGGPGAAGGGWTVSSRMKVMVPYGESAAAGDWMRRAAKG